MSLFLFAALGLAIDGGQMYAQRQMAQAAADAAAQAGIMSILRGTNATSANPFGTGSPPIASSVCTPADARTPCVYARYNGFGGTNADTVTLSFPTTVAGVTLSSATVPAFAVTVQRTLQTGLIRFIGPSTSSVTAKATAGLIDGVSPYCIYALDPSGQNAFQATGSAAVTVTGCAIAVNSDNADAATVSGTSSVTASAVNIVGGYSTGCSSGCGTITPTPVTGASSPPARAVPDPFSSLPTPAFSSGSCLPFPSGAAVSPGTYCGPVTIGGIRTVAFGAGNYVINGGLTVSNSAVVTFGAGDYVMNGGGVTFRGASTSSGSGVMFYLTGTAATYGSVNVDNSANLTLSAPTSGPYLGLVFFQDPAMPTTSPGASFSGAVIPALTGSLYFKTTLVSFANSASSASYMGIVAYQVAFTGAPNIKYDSTGLKTGLFQNYVALVQ